jgi:hypothetical protein
MTLDEIMNLIVFTGTEEEQTKSVVDYFNNPNL